MSRTDLRQIIWIGLGGTVGALLRHSAALIFTEYIHTQNFFTATFFVNITGSFLMGYFVTLFMKTDIPEEVRQFLLFGMLGSYTTYSGFGIEAITLLGESPLLFSLYIFSQVIMGVIALTLGLKLGD